MSPRAKPNPAAFTDEAAHTETGHSEAALITRREAIRRVTALLGAAALVGGSALLAGCRDDRAARPGTAAFTDDDVAFLDEVAETILPETDTPGAKAAGVGAFMALMVADTYDEREQRAFRDGMRQLDEACRDRYGTGFVKAAPDQRLALLEELDREQMAYMQARAAAQSPADTTATADTTAGTGSAHPDSAQADAYLPDQRQENAPAADASAAPGVTADAPPHYFRMMKELALLGYFTSEIGYTQAMRYVETPGRFDPCVPYTPGEKAWAPHA